MSLAYASESQCRQIRTKTASWEECPEEISIGLRSKKYEVSQGRSKGVYSHLLKLQIPRRLNAIRKKNNLAFIYDYCLNSDPPVDLETELKNYRPVDRFRARFWLTCSDRKDRLQKMDCSRLLGLTNDDARNEPPTPDFKTQVSLRRPDMNVLDIFIDEAPRTSASLATVLGSRPHYHVAMSTEAESSSIFINFVVYLRQDSHPVSIAVQGPPLEREALRYLNELDSVLGTIALLGLLQEEPTRLAAIKRRLLADTQSRETDELCRELEITFCLPRDLSRALFLASQKTLQLKEELLQDANLRTFFEDREDDILRRYDDSTKATEAKVRKMFPDPQEGTSDRRQRLKDSYFLTTFRQEVLNAILDYTQAPN
jgi:hypothetical protein